MVPEGVEVGDRDADDGGSRGGRRHRGDGRGQARFGHHHRTGRGRYRSRKGVRPGRS